MTLDIKNSGEILNELLIPELGDKYNNLDCSDARQIWDFLKKDRSAKVVVKVIADILGKFTVIEGVLLNDDVGDGKVAICSPSGEISVYIAIFRFLDTRRYRLKYKDKINKIVLLEVV